jgi:hypothetical protein
MARSAVRACDRSVVVDCATTAGAAIRALLWDPATGGQDDPVILVAAVPGTLSEAKSQESDVSMTHNAHDGYPSNE